ncbi:MAG: TonB-dependent receptor [Caenispirillum sp.]|nr:TonB-dependent receptor [Caenispirillum sp.]
MLSPAWPALAQETSPEPAHTFDPLVITAGREARPPGAVSERDLAPLRARTSDSARLLEEMPGVNFYSAGGISSLPAIRGLADDRLRIQVDGMDLMTACPNHMNPALSYIDPSRVARVTVFAGITPVSMGGDSLGGTIQVEAAAPRFATAGETPLVGGEAGLFSRSNGNARGWNLAATLAGEHLSLNYAESASEADNYRTGKAFKPRYQTGPRVIEGDEVGSSAYRGAENRELALALKGGGHLLQLSLSRQQVGFEGFPNQRMDMAVPADWPIPYDRRFDLPRVANDNRLVNLRYTGQFEWGELKTRLFEQNLDHAMEMGPDRVFGMQMPMLARNRTRGGLLQAAIELNERDLLRLGGDFQRYRLDDWWPPVNIGFPGAMCCDEFWNIRDGRRDRVGLFAEWEARWSPRWLTLLGVRGDHVLADAGDVHGYNTRPPPFPNVYRSDAARYNALEHRRDSHHRDFTALLRHTPAATAEFELGFARKTRSPNLHERHPWSRFTMAAAMNNFVGDGNAYFGNPDLKPEVARTLSGSALWRASEDERWEIRANAYLIRIEDYIDAVRCRELPCGADNPTRTEKYVTLTYANQAARLHGFDLSGRLLLGRGEGFGRFTLKGFIGHLRGRNTETGDDLYHIMPRHGRFALEHQLGGWRAELVVEKVADKTRVSRVRNEMPTEGYTLVHLRAGYTWKHARLDVGVENIADRLYFPPLGGAYVGQGNTMSLNAIPWRPLPGPGRSVNIALSARF